MVSPIREGTKGDAESFLNWWLFSPPLNETQIKDFLSDNDIGYWYAGPGQEFLHKPYVCHSNSYTLIQQYGGLDI